MQQAPKGGRTAVVVGEFCRERSWNIDLCYSWKSGDLVSVNEWELCVSDLYVRDRQLISFWLLRRRCRYRPKDYMQHISTVQSIYKQKHWGTQQVQM